MVDDDRLHELRWRRLRSDGVRACDISPSDTAQMRNFARWYAFAPHPHPRDEDRGGDCFSSRARRQDPDRVQHAVRICFTHAIFSTSGFHQRTGPLVPEFLFTVSNAASVGITPSVNAMWRVGKYFSNRGAAAPECRARHRSTGPGHGQVPAELQPDGNGRLLQPARVARSPGVEPGPIGNRTTMYRPPVAWPNPGFTPGSALPPPLSRRGGHKLDQRTVADTAMYYWINDLRPTSPISSRTRSRHGSTSLSMDWRWAPKGHCRIPRGISEVTTGAPHRRKPVNNTATAIDDLWHAA